MRTLTKEQLVESLKSFMSIHLKDNMELKEYQIFDDCSEKWETIYKLIDDIENKTLMSLDINDIKEYLKTKYFYTRTFANYSELCCVVKYLYFYYDISFKYNTTNEFLELYNIDTKEILYSIDKNEERYGISKIIEIAKNNYDYSLEKLIPYICPKCGQLYKTTKTQDNVTFYECSCGEVLEEIL